MNASKPASNCEGFHFFRFEWLVSGDTFAYLSVSLALAYPKVQKTLKTLVSEENKKTKKELCLCQVAVD